MLSFGNAVCHPLDCELHQAGTSPIVFVSPEPTWHGVQPTVVSADAGPSLPPACNSVRSWGTAHMRDTWGW